VFHPYKYIKFCFNGPSVLDFFEKKKNLFIFVVFVLDFSKIHFVKIIIFSLKMKSYFK